MITYFIPTVISDATYLGDLCRDLGLPMVTSQDVTITPTGVIAESVGRFTLGVDSDLDGYIGAARILADDNRITDNFKDIIKPVVETGDLVVASIKATANEEKITNFMSDYQKVTILTVKDGKPELLGYVFIGYSNASKSDFLDPFGDSSIEDFVVIDVDMLHKKLSNEIGF